jgi:hypothetical protein
MPTQPQIGIPYEPPRTDVDCTKRTPPEQHDMPEQWDYRYCPEGQKTCRKCGVTWYD